MIAMMVVTEGVIHFLISVLMIRRSEDELKSRQYIVTSACGTENAIIAYKRLQF